MAARPIADESNMTRAPRVGRVAALWFDSGALTVPRITHRGAILRNPRKPRFCAGFQCVLDHTVGGKMLRDAPKPSVDADGLEFLAPGIGDGRLAAVGQHDRRAVGR